MKVSLKTQARIKESGLLVNTKHEFYFISELSFQ